MLLGSFKQTTVSFMYGQTKHGKVGVYHCLR